MSTWDSLVYLRNVEEMVQKIRGRCLGHNVKLDELLPKEHRKLPCKERARQLAKLLLCWVADCNPYASREALERSGQWLDLTLQFLFRCCDRSDCTVGNLVLVVKLDTLTRCVMFEEMGCSTGGACTDMGLPEPLEHLELILLECLGARGLLCEGKTLADRVEQLM